MQTVQVPFVALHPVKPPTQGLSAQVIRTHCHHLDAMLSPPCYHPPLVSVWKRQRLQVVEDSDVSPVVITPEWVCQVREILPILPSLPAEKPPEPVMGKKQPSRKSCLLSPGCDRYDQNTGNLPG